MANLRKHKNIKCFNCGTIDHLKGIIDMAFLEIMFLLRLTLIESPKLLDYAYDASKAYIELINVD